MTGTSNQRGLAPVDVILALGTVALVASLVYPPLRQRAFRQRMEAIVAYVDAVRDAATRYRESAGHWPADAESGALPEGLAALLPADLVRRTADYALEWNRWDIVEVPPEAEQPSGELGTPPPAASLPGTPPIPRSQADSVVTRPPFVTALGGITVQTSEDAVLAALLDHYGSALSFVRDSSWTLVLGPPGTP